MKKLALFLMICILSGTVNGQDTLNRVDAQGRKQGYWIKPDKDGKKSYEGRFRDNTPVGEFKYYYADGKTKAVSVFSSDGKRSRTTTYFPNGKKMAEGNYLAEKKDSLWKFYSDIDGALTSEEFYRNGKKDGISKTYYAGDGLAETLTWKDGVRDGTWEQYYTDGKIKFRGTYVNDEKEGTFRSFFESGAVMSNGQYKNGHADGTWFYYDAKGAVEKKEYYLDGVLVKTDEVVPEKQW